MEVFRFYSQQQRIEANPNKIKAMLDMLPLSNIKDFQRLTGRIAALSRFVSRASDKCWPFFQVLKKGLLVGRTLPGIHGAQNLPKLSPHSGKPFRGRTPHSLPGRFILCN